MIARSALTPLGQAISQQGWTAQECLIEKAEIDSTRNDGIAVQYSYEALGEKRTGTTWALPSPVQTNGALIHSEMERLVPGSTVSCWVSPSDITQAVLVRESLWVGAILLIPLVGFIGSFFLIRSSFAINSTSTSKSSSHSSSTKTIRYSTDDPRSKNLAIYLFFGIFISVGAILTYVFFLRFALAVFEARSWQESSCTITSSDVRAHTSHDSKTGKSSTSYSVHVAYTFSHGGKLYSGNTYNLGSSDYTNSSHANEVISELPEGKVTPCFFDPTTPTHSSLRRELDDTVWFGLFPLVFTAGGLLGLLATVRSDGKKKGRSQGRSHKRAPSRIIGLLMLILVNVVWNGIVAVGCYAFYSAGSGGWLIGILIAPFALIGLLLLAGIPYAILQLFNPSVDIDFPDTSIAPGNSTTIAWRVNGNASRIRKLTILVTPIVVTPSQESSEGRSQPVGPMRGKSFELFSTDNPQRIEKGSSQITIPSTDALNQPETIASTHLELCIRLHIPWYPDAQDTVTVPLYSTPSSG